nr:anthranilate phosphoribosyltransferase [Legionella jordanis]
MNIKPFFEKLIAHQDLNVEEMQSFMRACMRGELSDVQIASFLSLMRMKGETVEELTSAATVMLELAHVIELGDGLIDIVGTGGDGKNTFNVSTISSFVVAAAGVKVAKHGNRSVSSKSGSADLLSHAGFQIELSDEALQLCMQECGLSFLFAPHFHRAMQHARNARQQLGIRTLFNLLGPLINPAGVKRQVVGVFQSRWLEPLAKVLANLGSERSLVINSQDGLDEVSISALTDVMEYRGGEFNSWQINPKTYDCFSENLNAIIVDSPAQSLFLAEQVLNGEKGPARNIVLLNAATALYCANDQLAFEQALEQAKQAIDSGEAAKRFKHLKELTQRAGQ